MQQSFGVNGNQT